MAEIVPAILTGDPATFQSQLAAFTAFSKRIQLDMSDGSFAPSTTILPGQIQALPTGIQVDLHLMVVRPSDYLPHILRLKPSLVIMHAESGENLLPIIEQLKSQGIKVGIALVPGTFPGRVKAYLDPADHALIFAGALGKQGGEADLLQMEKVKLIRALKPDLEIGWDGGANLTNIRALAHADLNVINVGSALSSAPDPAAAYEQLVTESNQRGVAI